MTFHSKVHETMSSQDHVISISSWHVITRPCTWVLSMCSWLLDSIHHAHHGSWISLCMCLQETMKCNSMAVYKAVLPQAGTFTAVWIHWSKFIYFYHYLFVFFWSRRLSRLQLWSFSLEASVALIRSDGRRKHHLFKWYPSTWWLSLQKSLLQCTN